MKRHIFLLSIVTLLAFASCESDNYYYYDPYIPSSGGGNVNIEGAVYGIDSMQPLKDVRVDIVFGYGMHDFDSAFTDTTGAFSYIYDYQYYKNSEIRFVCKPSDTLHAELDTILEMNGRDISSGLFTVSFVLDTL
jgi:hypothetical protein